MRLASSILLISTAVVTCSVISAIALRSEAENGGEKPVKRFPKTSDTTDNEDRMISMPNLAATRAGEFLAPKGEVMLGYTGPDYRPALVKSLKQFEDGADVRVSEILAYQHPKISGADVQASEIHANQDPKISGRPVMEEGGAARNGASIEPTGQELDTRKKLEVRKLTVRVSGWIEDGKYSPDEVLQLLKREYLGPSFFTDSILGTLNLFIELLNKKNEKTEGFIKDTLLKVLLRDFGGYSLARVLSVAKTKAGDGKLAKSLQTELLQQLVGKKYSVDDVFKGMWTIDKSVGVRLLAYTVVDTMKTFIGLFNKKHPDSSVNTFEYLMSMLKGDHILGLLLCKAKEENHDVLNLEMELHHMWADDDNIAPRDLAPYIEEMLGEGKQATRNTLDMDVSSIVQKMEKDYNKFYMKKFPDDVKNHMTFAQ